MVVSGRLPARLIAAIGLLALLVIPLLAVQPVKAFKPYTHAYASDDALADVIDDGRVTIEGQAYQVNPRVVQALRDYPEFYRGGVIGPDGFPDITYGQSVIHPENTGEWLRYIFDQAWLAQENGAYTEQEKLQILAFAYGYLTHAAGDMWMHTMINELSLGVFPGVGEILTQEEKAAIAIRHLVLEAYVGEATEGYDKNSERGPVGDDTSDDSTPPLTMDAPHRWVYNTLIDPNALTPRADRGPIIDGFLELRASLAAELSKPDPAPLQDAINAYDDTVQTWNDAQDDCNFEDVEDALHDIVACPIALAGVVYQGTIDSAEAFFEAMTGSIALAVDEVKDSYIAAWIDDIDEGLLHWNELGLAISRGMFDPQARRDAQNDICWPEGGEGETDRADCEDGLGMTDVVLHEANDFITEHLLSMAGAPDLLGEIIVIIQEFAHVFDFVSLIFDQLLNPIDEAIADVKERIKNFVLDQVKEALGIDIEMVDSFLHHPTYWLNVTEIQIELPGLGLRTIELFEPDTHERLDAYLGLGPDHHAGEFVFGDLESTRLKDDVVFDEATFGAFYNTLVLERLVLLDAGELNRVMERVLGQSSVIYSGVDVATFVPTTAGVPTNIMFQPLVGTEPWLQNIDSDHAWRLNPLPTFCNIGLPDCDIPGLNPTPRPAADNGGTGEFPIWESCVLRPAFRELFIDWENGGENFPDLNDAPSADPRTDPLPPSMDLTVHGNSVVNGSTTFVGEGHNFEIAAVDEVFTSNVVNIEYRVYPDGTAPGPWLPLGHGEEFAIPTDGGDGVWRIDFRAEDPCHTFVNESGSGADPLPPATDSTTVVLDTTAPVISIVSPLDGQVFDSDDFSAIDFTVNDGAQGSGVASQSVTLDGNTASDGQVLDMFLLATGQHQIKATAVDRLGNQSELAWSFKMQATSASLIGNIDRGYQEGLITNGLAYLRLRGDASMAAIPHATGNHRQEWHRLETLIAEFKLQRGTGVQTAFANKMIGWAQEIINERR